MLAHPFAQHSVLATHLLNLLLSQLQVLLSQVLRRLRRFSSESEYSSAALISAAAVMMRESSLCIGYKLRRLSSLQQDHFADAPWRPHGDLTLRRTFEEVRKAADQNHCWAQYNLGYCSHLGIGVAATSRRRSLGIGRLP